MDREALTRELTRNFQQSLTDAMDAVERAPDGAWIAGSEWQVREAFGETDGPCVRADFAGQTGYRRVQAGGFFPRWTKRQEAKGAAVWTC